MPLVVVLLGKCLKGMRMHAGIGSLVKLLFQF